MMSSSAESLACRDAPANAPLTVHALDDAQHAAWDDFVARCPEASFFHQAAWAQILAQVFGHRTHYLYAARAGVIEGVLPLAEIRSRLFGHSLVSLPFCVYGGIAADSEAARVALDEAAQALAGRLQVGHLEYRNTRPQHPAWPSSALYVTFRKPILPEVEANLLSVPRKQRAMIRKGMKAGLESQIDTDTERFFDAYASSVHRLGTPVFPRRYFRALKQAFGDQCEVLSVTRQGELVASVLSFYFRDEVLPYYGGGVPAARAVAGNDFMYWELMRRAAERGLRVFDFGRSKVDSGSYHFKRNWGFEPAPLAYEYQLHRARAVPQHNPNNPRYRMFIELWKRMPLPLANALGPHIVRNLG